MQNYSVIKIPAAEHAEIQRVLCIEEEFLKRAGAVIIGGHLTASTERLPLTSPIAIGIGDNAGKRREDIYNEVLATLPKMFIQSGLWTPLNRITLFDRFVYTGFDLSK
jgi:hypothetical protein